MPRLTHIILAILVVAVVLSPLQAQAEGVISTQSLRPIPEGFPVSVEPLDNSRENLRIQKEFEREREARGYRVEDGGRLILSFETRDEIGSYSSAGRRALVEATGHGGRTGGENARFRASIFDSKKGGVPNRGEVKSQATSTPSQYKLEVTLDDRSNGRRLWQAWSSADLTQQGEGALLIEAMVPAVVANLGKTVKSQPIDLP